MKHRFSFLAIVLLLTTSMSPVLAGSGKMTPMRKVLFRVGLEKWVTTTVARVEVSINATLSKAGLAKARNDIMKNLNHIAKGDWHVTQFYRSQDSSGLERLTVRAEARIGEANLTNVRKVAKSITRPGATYRISNIDFTPSLSEVQKVRSDVR